MQKTSDFNEKFRELVIESKLPVCELIDLNLYGIAQIAIADAKDVGDGLQHLSDHFHNMLARIQQGGMVVTIH